MSLVHNALKKAERDKQRMTGESRETDTVPNGAEPAASTGRQRRRLFPSAMAVVILICLAAPPAFYFIKLDQARQPAPVPADDLKAPVVPVIDEPAVSDPQDTPKIETVPAREYKLTGIMKDADQNHLAVLNNRVIGVGGYVEGATVRSIVDDRITIEVDGREQVLRLDGTTP